MLSKAQGYFIYKTASINFISTSSTHNSWSICCTNIKQRNAESIGIIFLIFNLSFVSVCSKAIKMPTIFFMKHAYFSQYTPIGFYGKLDYCQKLAAGFHHIYWISLFNCLYGWQCHGKHIRLFFQGIPRRVLNRIQTPWNFKKLMKH